MKSHLYRVWFINQATGDSAGAYVIADNLGQIEEEFADISSIEIIGDYTDLRETK